MKKLIFALACLSLVAAGDDQKYTIEVAGCGLRLKLCEPGPYGQAAQRVVSAFKSQHPACKKAEVSSWSVGCSK